MINDSWKVLGFLGTRRCLPVRVGRSSSAEQSTEPLRSLFFVEAFRVWPWALTSTLLKPSNRPPMACMAVCIELGDAELGTGYPAVGGDGFACTAKPLLVPLMINATATASTIVAPKTTARRTQ